MKACVEKSSCLYVVVESETEEKKRRKNGAAGVLLCYYNYYFYYFTSLKYLEVPIFWSSAFFWFLEESRKRRNTHFRTGGNHVQMNIEKTKVIKFPVLQYINKYFSQILLLPMFSSNSPRCVPSFFFFLIGFFCYYYLLIYFLKGKSSY